MKLKVLKQLSQNSIVCGNQNQSLKPELADFLKTSVSYNTPGCHTAVSSMFWRCLHLVPQQLHILNQRSLYS